ncbi:MAG: Crp/Fnr family transcriptional regulator [Oscillospiraceae bacterium]|nr:Crp/Fnr family transcriptional regulator [Oscillospiraceae bacterium]
MKNNISALKKSQLFSGITDEQLGALVKCLGCTFKSFDKDKIIYHAGNCVREVGLVIDGRVHIVKDDAWGNSNILAGISEGEMFAEAFVCGGVDELPVSVVAAAKSEIMFFDFRRVTAACTSACAFHTALIRNMIGVIARGNIALSGKMEHITRRTTKEKLLSYLSEQSRLHNSNDFEIPFDRQGLADYLSVERSALSAEMSKLKADGVINYRKNRFVILSISDCHNGFG